MRQEQKVIVQVSPDAVLYIYYTYSWKNVIKCHKVTHSEFVVFGDPRVWCTLWFGDPALPTTGQVVHTQVQLGLNRTIIQNCAHQSFTYAHTYNYLFIKSKYTRG